MRWTHEISFTFAPRDLLSFVTPFPWILDQSKRAIHAGISFGSTTLHKSLPMKRTTLTGLPYGSSRGEVATGNSIHGEMHHVHYPKYGGAREVDPISSCNACYVFSKFVSTYN